MDSEQPATPGLASSAISDAPLEMRFLFGGDSAWDPTSWTTADDRVRGGRSQSYLTISSSSSTASPATAKPDQPSPTAPVPSSPTAAAAAAAPTAVGLATFHGHLDITALGGAGFACQRTADSQQPLDLAPYATLVLGVVRADGKRYTLVLKDTLLPRRPDGRERSTVSWELDFAPPAGFAGAVALRLADFAPTYRGRPCPEAGSGPDLTSIKRMSLMMRRCVLA